MVVRTLLVRGLYAGLAAGLLSWVFSYFFGEPGIEAGIAFEEQLAHAGGESQGAELVGRGLQATVGLGAALVVFAVAMGGLFALAYAVAYGRIGALSPRATAAVLAAGAFLVVFLVPFLKYPPNPPGTSDDATIAQRTALYLGLVLASVILAVASVALGRRLNARLGSWNAGLVAIGVYVVSLGLLMFVLPNVNETPA
ncbi:MAG: CbtA family protein, partial [Actinomycetota bacterium]|nr:CbtA family protein [Actinomycetota bacterium]